MRIAQLYHDFSQRGGAERHVEALSSALGRMGHQVTIVAHTPPAGFAGFATQFARWAVPLSAVRLARWMRRERIQLLHAHSRTSALVAALAVKLHRIPLVVTSHILPDGFSRVSQWGDATICVSEAVRRHLVEDYGLSPSHATVIHNGVEEMAAAGLAAPCFGPPPVISMVARFVPGKGHELFLKTASKLLAGGFAGTFVLAGDGPLARKLRERYRHDRILFLGYRDDVPAIFAASRASVVCSESEAFPYVVLESLAAGTPVIATECGGPAEIIRHGRNGFLFPVGDAASLHRLLLAAAGDQTIEPRGEISRHCRETFGRRRMVESTLTVYRKICPEVGS